MKRIFIASIIIRTVFAGCRSKLSVEEFNRINDIKPKPGLSANTQKAVGSAYNTLSLKNIKVINHVFLNEIKWVFVDSLVYKFNVLLKNKTFCYQELRVLSKIHGLLILKLSTIEN